MTTQSDCPVYNEVRISTLCFGGFMIIVMSVFSYKFIKYFDSDGDISQQMRCLSILLMIITFLESLTALFLISVCFLPDSFHNFRLLITNILSLLWTMNCVFINLFYASRLYIVFKNTIYAYTKKTWILYLFIGSIDTILGSVSSVLFSFEKTIYIGLILATVAICLYMLIAIATLLICFVIYYVL